MQYLSGVFAKQRNAVGASDVEDSKWLRRPITMSGAWVADWADAVLEEWRFCSVRTFARSINPNTSGTDVQGCTFSVFRLFREMT